MGVGLGRGGGVARGGGELDADGTDHGGRVFLPEAGLGERCDAFETVDLRAQDSSVGVELRREGGKRTAVNAFLTSASFSSPISSTSSFPESTTSGTTLAKMSTAIKMEARGSNPFQP